MPEHTPAPTPSRAVYGFAMFLSFRVLFIVYVVWAVLPEQFFRSLGITYLPKRHWAVTIPIFLFILLLVFAFVIYPSMRYFLTPHPSSLTTICDSNSFLVEQVDETDHIINVSNVHCCTNKEKCAKNNYLRCSGDSKRKSLPVRGDLNIWDVSKRLYLAET